MVEPLSDPLNDRPIRTVEPPPHRFLPTELLFPRGITHPPDAVLLKMHLRKEGRVAKSDALLILRQVIETFKREKSMIEINHAVTVIGDIHGQFYDLLKLLDMIGDIGTQRLVFLGDYVDRGLFSVEVILVLYALKLNYPQNMFMIRGNHESRQLTTYFNFRSECLHKFDIEFYDTVCESFDMLPVACLINKKFLAVHAGISPELTTLDNISKLNRFTEPPSHGLLCDILWSDPVDNDNGDCDEKYKINTARGCGYYFGLNAVNTFLKRNKLLTIIRAHEVHVEGYKMHRWKGSEEFPVVITIFSAPNYCDVYKNKAAVIRFEDDNLDVRQFGYSGHPYYLPEYQDLFSWSIPFMIEKVLEILNQIINQRPAETDEDTTTSGEKVIELQQSLKESKIGTFRKKVKALSKMIRIFKTIREEKELILELKGLCPDQKIPKGLIECGRKALEGAISAFNAAKEWDTINEKRPLN